MFEDSFLDSFMESHIGGWTADTERMYEEDDWVEPMDFGDLLSHNQRHLDEADDLDDAIDDDEEYDNYDDPNDY